MKTTVKTDHTHLETLRKAAEELAAKETEVTQRSRKPVKSQATATPAEATAVYDGIPGGHHVDGNAGDRSLDTHTTNAPNQAHEIRHFDNVEQAFDNLKCMPGGGPSNVRLLTGNNDKWLGHWSMPAGDRAASYFTIQRDIFGTSYLGKALMDARQGFNVRVLTDSFANLNLGFSSPSHKVYLETLVTAGAQMGLYNEVHKRPLLMGDGNGVFKYMCQTHDKIDARDGCCQVGGSNIGKDYFSAFADHGSSQDPPSTYAPWRDTDALIFNRDKEHDVAGGAWDAVDVEFNNGVTTKLKAPHGPGKEVELLGAYVMMDIWTNAAPFSEAEKLNMRKEPRAREAVEDALVAQALERLSNETAVEYVGKKHLPVTTEELAALHVLAAEFTENLELRGGMKGFEERNPLFEAETKFLDQTGAASTNESQIWPGLAELAMAAHDSIYIENPYACLTEDEIRILEAAGKRGVKIILGTNSPESTDSAATQAFFLNDWPMLLARIPNLQIFVSTKTKLHAKTETFDGLITVVQTANSDLISRHINSEIAGVHKSKDLATKCNQVFLHDRDNKDNGVKEYKIKRNPDGTAFRDENGKLVEEFGPNDHISTKLKVMYAIMKAAAKAAVVVDNVFNQDPKTGRGRVFGPFDHPNTPAELAEEQRKQVELAALAKAGKSVIV